MWLVILALLVPAAAAAQSTGTLIPAVPGQWFDNNGDPCSGCLLYSYAAGTTTPLSTYSDSALSVANANPVVLDAAGRATVYLSASSYKFILTSAAAATIWTRDSVSAVPYVSVAAAFNSTCDGRLTLTSGTAITVTDVTASTSVYFTPYQGGRCAFYDGSQWSISSFTEKSLALGTDTANTNYDVFFYLSAGTPTLERLAWASDTTRATNITLQDGVYVKAGETTKRYVGTYRTTGSAGQTEDSVTKRFLWNYQHRVLRALRVTDSTDTWAYTTASFRQANNSAANQVAVVVGVAEVVLSLRLNAQATNSVAAQVAVAIGQDSTGAPAAGSILQNGTATSSYAVPSAAVLLFPTAGYHYYPWLETSQAAGTTTWYGDAGSPTTLQSGLTGQIEG